MQLPGAVLTDNGTPEQKEALLRPMITREWSLGCLLYTEPGAGSDLAAIQTRADLDESGENCTIGGQKVRTTNAHRATYTILHRPHRPGGLRNTPRSACSSS